jgi:hypothetical protein
MRAFVAFFIVALAAVVGLDGGSAWAQDAMVSLDAGLVDAGQQLASSDPFGPISDKASTAKTQLTTILQTVGVIGFICVCLFAIFSRGNFPWGWAAAIAGGFLLVGLSPTLISWLLDVGSSGSSSSGPIEGGAQLALALLSGATG